MSRHRDDDLLFTAIVRHGPPRERYLIVFEQRYSHMAALIAGRWAESEELTFTDEDAEACVEQIMALTREG